MRRMRELHKMTLTEGVIVLNRMAEKLALLEEQDFMIFLKETLKKLK